MTFDEAFNMAMIGELPADAPEWELKDNKGWTVAHRAAQNGVLPDDFDRWELELEYGYTVAHAAAVRGILPVAYNDLDRADRYGRTVRDMLQHSKGYEFALVACYKNSQLEKCNHNQTRGK